MVDNFIFHLTREGRDYRFDDTPIFNYQVLEEEERMHDL